MTCKSPATTESPTALIPLLAVTWPVIIAEPVTSKLFVVACIEPVWAKIPSCPSIPVDGIPVKPAPLPTKEPLKVEPLIEVAGLKSTTEEDTMIKKQ